MNVVNVFVISFVLGFIDDGISMISYQHHTSIMMWKQVVLLLSLSMATAQVLARRVVGTTGIAMIALFTTW